MTEQEKNDQALCQCHRAGAAPASESKMRASTATSAPISTPGWKKGQSIDEIIAEMGTPQEVAAGFNEEMQDQLLPQRQPLALGVPYCGDTGGRSSTAFHSSLSAFFIFKAPAWRYRRCRRADGHFYNRRCKSSRPGAHTAVARRSLHSGMLRRLRAAALGGKTGRVQSIRLL